MIPWVHVTCRAWGSHRRWELNGIQGWPERSILGRLIDEGPGAGHVGYGSSCPIKDPPREYALVALSLQLMAETHVMEKPYKVLNAHYVLPGKAKDKAPDLKVTLPQYWSHLHTAHAFIVGVEALRGVLSQDKAA